MQGEPKTLTKVVDMPSADYFLLNKSWGVAHSWLRRWR